MKSLVMFGVHCIGMNIHLLVLASQVKVKRDRIRYTPQKQRYMRRRRIEKRKGEARLDRPEKYHNSSAESRIAFIDVVH